MRTSKGSPGLSEIMRTNTEGRPSSQDKLQVLEKVWLQHLVFCAEFMGLPGSTFLRKHEEPSGAKWAGGWEAEGAGRPLQV